MSRKPEEETVVIRLARSPQDVLKVMVVRGIARRMAAFPLEEGARRGADRYKLHAQVHLEAFYRDLGFTREGEVFDECGIDHVLMLRESSP